MRYIDDTEEVQTTLGDGTAKPFRVRDFIRHMVRSARQLNSDFDGMRKAERIDLACDKAGPHVALETGDWDVLCEIVRAPQPLTGFMAYPLSPAHKCRGFCEKILGAMTRETSPAKPKR